MKPSEFKISISVESYDEKTAENYRNCYVAEKHIAYKLSKISIPNLKRLIEDLTEDCVKIQLPYLLYFPSNKPSKSVTVVPGWIRTGRFIVLNDLASSKMVIWIYSNLFRYFLKVLELFECRALSQLRICRPPCPHSLRSSHLDIKDAQCAKKMIGVKFDITSYRAWAPRGSKKDVLGTQKFNFFQKLTNMQGRLEYDLTLILCINDFFCAILSFWEQNSAHFQWTRASMMRDWKPMG